MSKKSKVIILISFLVLIVLALISFMVFVIVKGTPDFIKLGSSEKTSNNLIYDKEYSSSFDEIIVNSDSADIEFKESDNSNIKVLVYSEKDENLTVTDKTSLNIKLEMKKKVNFFEFNYTNSKIEVYLPKDYDKNINIENNYGDIYISEFINSNIDIKSDCGDIEIEAAKTIKLENNFGDTIIKKSDDLEITADCGDIEINEVNTIKAKNSYGDIKIKNVNEYMNITADCGDIEIENILLSKNSKIKNDYGDVEIENIPNVYIDAETDLGDVKINKNYRSSDIILEIKNDCGDIEVNN